MSVLEDELGFEFRPTPKWVKTAIVVFGVVWFLQIPGFLLGLML